MLHFFKKILGVIFILMSILISFSAIKELLIAILDYNNKKIENSDSTYHLAYLIGSILGFGLLILLAFFLIRYGVKLIKAKEKTSNTDIIDEEFKN